jgi:diguanylate cyclase (GGDEF)-like protein
VDRGIDSDVAAKLHSFVEQSSDFIGVADPWGRILYMNPAACKRLGVADYADLTLADLFPAEVFSYYYEVVRPELLRTGAWCGEVLVNAPDGGAVPMYISTTAQLGPGGETQGGVVVAHDLPGVAPMLAGTVDDVSGVADRSVFRDQVELAIDAATRRGELCALVLATIDMSQTIERFGALTATNVVRALAGRMTRLARTIDVVGRVGEYQLGLLLRGVRSHNEALRLARTVYDALVESPVTTPSGQVAPGVACGLALGKAADSADDLIERAAVPIFSDATEAPPVDLLPPTAGAPAPLGTMDEFMVGLSHGDVQPYAARVVDLGSGREVGYQGLARWHHPQRGVLDADVFTDLIAGTPLASEVDLYVTREIAAMLTLLARDDDPLRVYVPVSKRLVADVHTEQYLWEVADAFSLRMEQLCLQVGRVLLESWSPALQDALVSLHDAGVTLVVTDVEQDDDARRFLDQGFDEVHLAPALGRAAARDAAAWSTVQRIVAAAHAGGQRVVATGIDDLAQRDAVVRAGVDLATGRLYGEPVPTDTIE